MSAASTVICPAPGCTNQMRWNQLMCGFHYRSVNRDIHDMALIELSRAPQTKEHLAAVRQAIREAMEEVVQEKAHQPAVLEIKDPALVAFLLPDDCNRTEWGAIRCSRCKLVVIAHVPLGITHADWGGLGWSTVRIGVEMTEHWRCPDCTRALLAFIYGEETP